MELRQLEYFVAVARHGQVTRAAEALWITQSALSQQIRRLETELGVALLHRGARGVELTAAGEELLPRAEAALGELVRARVLLDRHADATRGRVRIAATVSDAPRLPAAIAAFHRAHPGVQIALRQASAADAVAFVQRGAADVALASLPGPPPAGVVVLPLTDEPVRAMLAPDDPLDAVRVADLRGRPFILSEPGSALRAAVMEACQTAGFSPLPLFEVADPGTVRHLVHAGLGVSLVPASWFALPGPPVREAELGERSLRHRVGLLAPAAGLTPAAERLREVLEAELAY